MKKDDQTNYIQVTDKYAMDIFHIARYFSNKYSKHSQDTHIFTIANEMNRLSNTLHTKCYHDNIIYLKHSDIHHLLFAIEMLSDDTEFPHQVNAKELSDILFDAIHF